MPQSRLKANQPNHGAATPRAVVASFLGKEDGRKATHGLDTFLSYNKKVARLSGRERTTIQAIQTNPRHATLRVDFTHDRPSSVRCHHQRPDLFARCALRRVGDLRNCLFAAAAGTSTAQSTGRRGGVAITEMGTRSAFHIHSAVGQSRHAAPEARMDGDQCYPTW